ncbi:hypothetical protein JXB12_12085 [candidate division KSB1 bacterium]|nr:hypothetical protein [candidate division KSB1 bacterium]
MKYFASFIFLSLFLVTIFDLSAQDSPNQRLIFPHGISLEYGIGGYAHTDEYISKEKFSGNLPYYKASFINYHEKYLYQIGIEFRSASDIKNYNVSAEVYQFSLNQGFLYPLPEFHLLSKKAYAYIGPSTEVFIYSNVLNIAVSGFDYAQSYAGLFSLGLNSALIYPLSDNFYIETSLNFDVLSLGFRMVDLEENDESPVKPLTLFSGTNGAFKLGIRYYLSHKWSVKASYLFAATRISSWEPLYAASDNLVFTITYGL